MVNPEAARRARRKAIKQNLIEAYDDEEACPPEWVDLLSEIREQTKELMQDVAVATERFAAEPDIRRALRGRESFVRRARERVVHLNARTERLNLIAPDARFTRPSIDPDELLRPLFSTGRRAG